MNNRLRQWSKLTANRPSISGNRLAQVLLYFNLPQDLDVLLPLAVQLQQHPKFHPQAIVSRKAWQQSPRIQTQLTSASIQLKVVSHKTIVVGLQPRLRRIQALVTASESTASAHRGPHALTQRANQQQIPTYTLQHGFENIGLTYFSSTDPDQHVKFASRTIFTWGPLAQLSPEVLIETKRKCVAVGCPKLVQPLTEQRLPPNQIPELHQYDRLVAVCENMHWARYSDHYRESFLKDLIATARTHPTVAFLVKPHHSSRWFIQQSAHLQQPTNLFIADPSLPTWEAYTAPALIDIADIVITTPSTVAVDACRASCPVAIVAYDLTLDNYRPLPLLRSSSDWQNVVEQTNHAKPALIAATKRFLETQMIGGDAVAQIINRLIVDLEL